MFPALLNNLSEGELVAGIAKYFLDTLDKIGYFLLCSFHHSSVSASGCSSSSTLYFSISWDVFCSGDSVGVLSVSLVYSLFNKLPNVRFFFGGGASSVVVLLSDELDSVDWDNISTPSEHTCSITFTVSSSLRYFDLKHGSRKDETWSSSTTCVSKFL